MLAACAAMIHSEPLAQLSSVPLAIFRFPHRRLARRATANTPGSAVYAELGRRRGLAVADRADPRVIGLTDQSYIQLRERYIQEFPR